eukprot:TRINITY_DN24572_c0_g1_i1.p1 TRINITY_DN24572_c0_g1~~TRINITY_DN24572_c0_g1_i1.p1  ORF type:complete len:525 (+),score=115.40 TRINITY_DN24572_c0_g1_i1:42-1616(+)
MGSAGSDGNSDLEMWAFLRARPRTRGAVYALWASFFVAYMNVGIPVSYLPTVVTRKGAAVTWVGISYAVQPLAIAMTQPFCRKVEQWVGNEAMFQYGCAVAGVATVLCAALDWLTDDAATFVALLCVNRFIGGVGEGLLDTAILNIYQDVAPEIIAQIMGVSEGVIGLGIAVGPFLGGLFYELQGFELPMLVGGGMIIAMGRATPWALRRARADRSEEAASPGTPSSDDGSTPSEESGSPMSPSQSTRRRESRLSLLRSVSVDACAPPGGFPHRSSGGNSSDSDLSCSGPLENDVAAAAPPRTATSAEMLLLLLVALCVVCDCFAFGAMEAITPLRLHDFFGMTEVAIGTIMGGTGIAYLICGTLLGGYVDKWCHAGTMNATPIIVGQVLNFVSCLLLAPVPALRDAEPGALECAVVVVGSLLNGVAMAVVCIPAMGLYSTYAPHPSAASQLFNGSLNLGLGLGATICGLAMAGYGYPAAMSDAAWLSAAYLVLIAPWLPSVHARAAREATTRDAARRMVAERV